MHVYLKYNADKIFQKVLSERLESFEIDYDTNGGQEILIKGKPEENLILKISDALLEYGIEVIQDSRSQLIQRIKDLLSEIVFLPEILNNKKVSVYLTEATGYSYSYLSKVFSEFTHYSIEQFLILKKIDVAKQLIIEDQLTLTDIAYRLNYSGVAHLSKQFKKTTGLTPTTFYELIKKRATGI